MIIPTLLSTILALICVRQALIYMYDDEPPGLVPIWAINTAVACGVGIIGSIFGLIWAW